MFCPECGTQNPDGSRFCSSCATQLPLANKPNQEVHGEGPLGTKVMPPVTNPNPNAPTNPFGPPPDQQNYGGYPGNSGNMPPNYQQNPYQQQQQQQQYQNPQYQNPYPQPQYQPFPQPQQVYPKADKPSGKAIAAGVLGIASIFPGPCIGIGPILGAIAAVLGKTEMDAIQRGQAARAGDLLAKIGFFCGIAGAIISFLTIISCAVFS